MLKMPYGTTFCVILAEHILFSACRDKTTHTDQPVFDEASFQHLRKQMIKDYGSSEMDLARLNSELVVCEYQKDKHVFWLRLRHGDLHRSVKQLHLDWDRRKAANKGLQNLSPSAAQCSDRLQASTALKSQTESWTWLRKQPRTQARDSLRCRLLYRLHLSLSGLSTSSKTA